MMRSPQPLTVQDSGKLFVDQTEVARFWAHMAQHTPWGRHHPGHGASPWSIYGDEAKYNVMGDKIVLIHISPVLMPNNGRGSSASSTLVFEVHVQVHL